MKFLFSLFAGLFFLTSSAGAQEAATNILAPDALIKEVTEEVLSIVRQNREVIQSGNTQKVMALIYDKVVPHFNFQRMTNLAMGRDWREANPEQRQRLTEEFKTLMIRTYSNALSGYRDQTFRYRPFRMQPADTSVIVRTEVVQPGSQPIQVEYSLMKQDNGWKVYDVVVAGVSLVTNYRTTFNQEVRANGIDGLIRMLADRNRQLEAS